MYVCTNNYVHDVLCSVALPVRVNYLSGSTPCEYLCVGYRYTAFNCQCKLFYY